VLTIKYHISQHIKDEHLANFPTEHKKEKWANQGKSPWPAHNKTQKKQA